MDLSVSRITIEMLTVTMQKFCKEFVPWKALRHPNVLPLLGVIMTETKFAMVSEWMSNGNINQFVPAHQDANRFELVSSPFERLRFSPIVDDCVAPIVGRRRKGLDIRARPGNGPRGS
jgi:serine/threonine protein kinase